MEQLWQMALIIFACFWQGQWMTVKDAYLEANLIFSRGFLIEQHIDQGLLLWYTWNIQIYQTVRFFVALLKFPPIVQSGLILFRNWTRCGRSLTQDPPFSETPLAVVLMCGQWHHSFPENDSLICNFLYWKTVARETQAFVESNLYILVRVDLSLWVHLCRANARPRLYEHFCECVIDR